MTSPSPMVQTIVEVLGRRVTDEDVNLTEAAQSIIDALRLRQEWVYRLPNGDSGLVRQTRDGVEADIEGITPTPGILHRLVTDWTPEDTGD